MNKYSVLDSIESIEDLKNLSTYELNDLSQDIRTFLIDNISKTGGHLASNLGVVELTIALHYFFNSPTDKIVWDVGHQSYVHKILTQRKKLFHTLRQYNGISGFPKRKESVHDVFEVGHSSTSISVALGMARARDIKGGNEHIVCVIGDGALSGGMAFEALNDAGHTNTNLMVILNDNEMSISENVGALSSHLSKIRLNPNYTKIKREVESVLRKVPWLGATAVDSIERIKNSLKYLLVKGIIFEEMGFTYIGPIDGHNVHGLLNVLKHSSSTSGPVLVHVLTKKGKGYIYAEENPEIYHGVPPFAVCNGKFVNNLNNSYSKVFGNKLVQMAKKDKRIVAITAAMPEGTGLLEFKEQIPERFFDVGIAEQHAVTFAAGLANSGLKPYLAVYSTFLQRAYDQILHDVCLQDLPVVFAIDRAGLVGEDGETHQGVFDISFLRHIPNITILSPKNTVELENMIEMSLDFNHPIAIRYPRGCDGVNTGYADNTMNTFDWEVVREGKDICILAVGKMVDVALRCSDILTNQNINCHIVNARVIKPLDAHMLNTLAKNFSIWVTIEDNVIQGGFGSSVNEYVFNNSMDVVVHNFGIPDKFIPHGSVEEIFEMLSLDPQGFASSISRIIANKREKIYVSR